LCLRIGLNPSDEYTLLIMCIPVGDYYKGGLSPVSALVIDDYDRAAPKGVGNVKVTSICRFREGIGHVV
jgi:branched-chain amino acid aminotransferase